MVVDHTSPARPARASLRLLRTDAATNMSAAARAGRDSMRIGLVSELLGVPVPTLRSWERRYQVPPVKCPDGATRRYTPTDVQMLVLMRDDVARGIRAADAAGSVRRLFDAEQPGMVFVMGMLAAAERLDGDALYSHLERATAELGLGACLDEVVFPFMRRIGLSWQTQRCEVGHERAATEIVGGWLTRRAAVIPLSADAPVILLARAPGDRHSIGLHALAVLLHEHGFRCRAPAGELATRGLLGAVEQVQPVAVVLVSHLPATRGRASTWLRTLQELGPEVFYAGNAFASPRNRRAVPGTYLGLNLQRAAALINTTVGPAPTDSTVRSAGVWRARENQPGPSHDNGRMRSISPSANGGGPGSG